MRFYKILVASHAGYILITAMWPLIDIESFMAVTGPKRDVWLVKTVGALLIPIAFTLFFLRYRKDVMSCVFLGSSTAIAFIVIDFNYALNDTISDVYLADGCIEILFLAGWIYCWRTASNTE